MPFVYESSYSIDLMELKRLTEALSLYAFYDKNGFRQLQPLDDNKDTRLMFFDMLTVTE